MKLAELAELTGSEISQGDPGSEIGSAAGLDIAQPGDITFLANPKYTPQLRSTKASAVFLAAGVPPGRDDIAVLTAADPYVAYTVALRHFFPEKLLSPGVHPSAVIDDTAALGQGCEVGANVVIGKDCVIGNNVRFHPNVTLYDGVTVGDNCTLHSGVSVRETCVIGANCIVHNNSTIGSDGFGYARTSDKAWLKIPQTGRVVLEDDVEIGANTAIDCASVGETRIKRGAKIDNLVQIGHSCTVDEDALICAQTGLAGSSHIGKRVILTGQVGIAGHLKIGDDVVMTAKSAISHDVEPGKVMSGVPAFENREWLRATAAFRKLGEFAARLRKLEKKVFSDQSE